MAQVIQADESGALVEDWWINTTPEQRVAWLEEWIDSLPGSPELPRATARRDSMYD